ncbi:hypothetical protein N9K28_03390 [Candidatus Pelagibacter sp.]|nr:hypothetical protein [Candidatus Pelagibacter sp.]MDC0455112.1 hypothetical protein [Candidatus Pelagibacter sp.]|tara:strand:+ start:34 stop:285 length:252 start_codon:yes stop_codon:yes gene_type:complete
MKKLFLSILVICSLLGGNAYAAEKMTVNSLLDEGYKITKQELVKFDRYVQEIFTLKKRNQVKICTVRIRKVLGVSNYSKCMTP